MEETRRRPRLGAVLGVLAMVLAGAALWAASAFAGDGSSQNTPTTGSTPAASVEQAQDAPDRDCPEREGDSGESGSGETSNV